FRDQRQALGIPGRHAGRRTRGGGGLRGRSHDVRHRSDKELSPMSEATARRDVEASNGRVTWLLKQGLRIWETWGIGLVLALLIILMAFIAPHFFSLSNLFNIARSTSIIAVLAAGMTVVILIAGIDLSVGSVLAVSGVISVIGWNAGLPGWLAVIVGVIVGALAGMVNGMLVAYLSLAGFIVTLAGLTAYRGVAYALTDGRPLTAEGELGFHLLGDGNFIGVPIPVWIMIATYAVLWF